jgi:hypothetical protein
MRNRPSHTPHHRLMGRTASVRAAMGPGTQLPGPTGRTLDLAMGVSSRRPSVTRLSGAVTRSSHRRRG